MLWTGDRVCHFHPRRYEEHTRPELPLRADGEPAGGVAVSVPAEALELARVRGLPICFGCRARGVVWAPVLGC